MSISQIERIVLLFLFCFLIANIGYAQKELTSEEAYKQDFELLKTATTFHYKEDFHLWYSAHVQRVDLIPKIKNRHDYVMHFYTELGHIFRKLEHHRESLKMHEGLINYLDVNEALISPELKQKYLESRSYAYRSNAVAYQNLSLLDSANFEHQKNLKFTDTITTIYKPAAINDYGMFLYGGIKNSSLALLYFQEAYTLVKENFPEHFILGSICENMATIYYEKGEIENAKILYEDNFEFYKKIPHETYKVVDAYLLVKAGAKIVDIEIIRGNLKQAERAYIELLNAFNHYDKPPYNKEKTKLEFLKSKQQFFEATKKTAVAYVALKEINKLSDSINQANTSESIKRIAVINELIIDKTRSSFKIEKAHKETLLRSQQLKLWIISITAISCVGFLTALYLRRRGRIIIAKNKQLIAEQSFKLTDLENKQLQSDIASKKRDLSDFAINLSQNQEWARNLFKMLNDLKQTTGRARKKMFNNFEQELFNKISFDQNTQEFYNRMDEVSDSFYKKLKFDFPKLSKTDIRLCSLIRLKIDSHEIATLQNITQSSLNTSRYRLRKKLRLTETEKLDDFIQSL